MREGLACAFRVSRAGAETQALAAPGWLAEQGPSVFTGTQRGAGAGAGPLEALPFSLHSGRTEALSPLAGSVEGGGVSRGPSYLVPMQLLATELQSRPLAPSTEPSSHSRAALSRCQCSPLKDAGAWGTAGGASNPASGGWAFRIHTC